MRFCFIFCAFLGELPCILGRLPSFFSVDFWYIRWQIINVYKISIFITFGYGAKRKTDRQP